MPHFKIPLASYRNGIVYPAGSVVESAIHEASTGSRLCTPDGKVVPGVKPLTKAEIEAAGKAYRASQGGGEVSATEAAAGLSVSDALEDGVDEVGDDEAKPKGKKAKKAADDGKLPA